MPKVKRGPKVRKTRPSPMDFKGGDNYLLLAVLFFWLWLSTKLCKPAQFDFPSPDNTLSPDISLEEEAAFLFTPEEIDRIMIAEKELVEKILHNKYECN